VSTQKGSKRDPLVKPKTNGRKDQRGVNPEEETSTTRSPERGPFTKAAMPEQKSWANGM